MNISKMHMGTSDHVHQDRLDRTGPENVTEQRSQEKEKTASTLEGAVSKDNISVSDIWGKVAQNIDVREASPREIIDLSSQLYKANAISYDDHINLSFQPEVNLDSDLESKPFSHEKKDYIVIWQAKEQNVIRFGGDRNQIEDTHRIQAILTYVDSLK